MKSFYVHLLNIVSCLLILSSCGTPQPGISRDLQKSFETMFPDVEMNTYLRIQIIKGNEHKFGSDVHILVENVSQKAIYFSTDTKAPWIKILVASDNHWIEVPNPTTYFSITGGNGYILFGKHDAEHPNLFTTSVRPMLTSDLENIERQVPVRIVVLGELMSNGERTGVPAGAYVDLLMEP